MSKGIISSLALVLPLLVATLSGAQDYGYGSSPTIHDVQVGPNALLKYDPPYINAKKGDKVKFHFNAKNHTATQSSFDYPCSRLSGGFDSDFKPTDGKSAYSPEFTIDVEDDTKPIWAYCRQIGHCQQGMVFAINPPKYGNTFEEFKKKALGTASSSTTTTSAPHSTQTPVYNSPTTHNVTVGADGKFLYSPEHVEAKVGEYIRFKFDAKNHTATQSSFESPCTPLYGGVSSGFKPTDGNDKNPPEFTFKVTDTKPTWFHCEQTGHCGQGMVFAVNAPSTGNTFDEFKKRALASGSSSATSQSSYYSTSTDSYHSASSSPYHSTPTSSYDSTSKSSYYSAPTGTYTSASCTDTPRTITVIVGGDDLRFHPESVEAKRNDKIRFEFHQTNHTVTQSSFNAPCTELEHSSWGAQHGFDSGFNNPVLPNATHFPSYEITVSDDKPIWAYCRQKGHCQAGMVFAVNPPRSGPNTFAAFQKLAMHSESSCS